MTAELKRRAEVYEELKRKHDDIEAEYTYSQELRPYMIHHLFHLQHTAQCLSQDSLSSLTQLPSLSASPVIANNVAVNVRH